MAMGKGMKMYLMNESRRENRGEPRSEDQQHQQRVERNYRLDGTYNVQVGGGGNRSEGGQIRTGGSRIGDPRSMNDYEMPDARYRGKDGRYHAGTRRSEYDGDQMHMGDDEEETYEVTIAPHENLRPMVWPYAPRYEGEDERYANYGNEDGRSDRQIGFGASMHMDDGRTKQSMQKGKAGTMMNHGMDEQTAREWVDSMQSMDKAHPRGGKWTPEQLEALAKKHGVPTTGKEWWEFYAMVNAMYSDYCEVAKRYNITSPDFYAQMALAFINDKDAVDDKVMKYWQYIAK